MPTESHSPPPGDTTDFPTSATRRRDARPLRSLAPEEVRAASAIDMLRAKAGMTKVLLIEDGETLLGASFARPPLADPGWTCDRAVWNSFAFESLGGVGADLIVASGAEERSRLLAFSHWLRDHPIRTPTIVVLPEDSEDELLRACFEAADDCVLCPLRPDELRLRITRILGCDSSPAATVKDQLYGELGLARFVGTDKNFLREIEKIPLAARNDGEILITGETGTGKELCARAVHQLNGFCRYRDRITTNCGPRW